MQYRNIHTYKVINNQKKKKKIIILQLLERNTRIVSGKQPPTLVTLSYGGIFFSFHFLMTFTICSWSLDAPNLFIVQLLTQNHRRTMCENPQPSYASLLIYDTFRLIKYKITTTVFNQLILIVCDNK